MLAASASSAVWRQAWASMPVHPGARTTPRKAEPQRLWSVMAATSSPAARIQANARAGSPAPSDNRVWLCRSAWASQAPGNSLDWRLVPQASRAAPPGSGRSWGSKLCTGLGILAP
jgi:hypothetical protein